MTTVNRLNERGMGMTKDLLRLEWFPNLTVTHRNIVLSKEEKYWIAESDLEDAINAILEKAQRVYSCGLHAGKACGLWSNDSHQDAHNTHTALLINIQPIQRKVTKAEIQKLLDDPAYKWDLTENLLKRILEHGVES